VEYEVSGGFILCRVAVKLRAPYTAAGLLSVPEEGILYCK
jgi:hypothetical protein